MKSRSKRLVIFCILSMILLLIGLFWAVSAGAKTIGFHMVLKSIFQYEEILDMQLIRDIRLPRAIATILVGGILGLIGAMMQGVTRNPVSEPSLMGIPQGATLAIALLYAGKLPIKTYNVAGAALLGAMVSGSIVLLFSMQVRRNNNMARILLAGTACSTFFLSLASVIALLTNQSQLLGFWVAGGFSRANWSSVSMLLVVGVIGVIIAMILAPKINIVHLGEDAAIGLGENPGRIRLITMILIIPLCAVTVSVAGNIGFVGLIIPAIVKKIVGIDYRLVLPCSFLLGAVLMVYADILARLFNSPYETPVGLFTAIIGVPFFLYIVRKEKS